MNKSSLENTLDKSERISNLNLSSDRFGEVGISTDFNLERPLRIAFFSDISIDTNTIENLLEKCDKFWDIIFLVDDNQIILKRNMFAYFSLIQNKWTF